MSRIERRGRTGLKAYGQSFGFSTREPVILTVEGQPNWCSAIKDICDFLDVRVIQIGDLSELRSALRDERPMAVLSEMESEKVDGCDVLKFIGAHDPELPVMLLTEGDPALLGAAEAVQEVWELSGVSFEESIPSPGEMVEFLFRAGQRGRCLGLMPA